MPLGVESSGWWNIERYIWFNIFIQNLDSYLKSIEGTFDDILQSTGERTKKSTIIVFYYIMFCDKHLYATSENIGGYIYWTS